MQQIPYKFHSERFGKEGIPLVMLHGFGQTLESLRPLALLLSESRNVLLVDLPGFGKSEFDESLISASAIAKALKSFLCEKGIDKADVLGHSFGGKVAMGMAYSHPAYVRNLILIATSGLKRKRGFIEGLQHAFIKLLGRFVKAADKTFGTEFFQAWFTPLFASRDYKQFPHVRKILVRSINENIDSDISLIKNPTLLLWGALDKETPLEMAYRLHRMIQNSSIVVYPTLGHTPFKDVGRHLMKEHVERFLNAGNSC